MSEEIKLLPCPFCGGTELYDDDQRVQCNDCFAESPVTAWNTRAANAAIPPAGGVEELREWALERSAVFHRLAHEDEHLRTQYIASSTAYRELAFEIANRAALNNTSPTTGAEE